MPDRALLFKMTAGPVNSSRFPETVDYSTLSACNLDGWCYFYLFCLVIAQGSAVIILKERASVPECIY